MPASRRSRKAEFWRSLDPNEIASDMAQCYAERAGTEVLLLAFLAERNLNPVAVRFWLQVYDRLKGPPELDDPQGRA